MTIEEAKQKTTELQANIKALMNEYIEQTGCYPTVSAQSQQIYVDNDVVHTAIDVHITAALMISGTPYDMTQQPYGR